MQQAPSPIPVSSAPEVVIDHATEAQIVVFLREHSSDFSPSLDVCLDISAYARKLRQHAHTFEIWDGQKLDALMAAYFNEALGQIFISHLCAARSRSGKGLGSLLMNQLKRYGEPYRVIRLEVRKDNLHARAFYARHGFSLESETEERLMLIYPLGISSSSSSATHEP